MRTLALFPVFALGGCIFNFGGEKACDASATSSVAVTVSAADGGDVSAAVVTHSVEGDPFQPCDDFPGSGEYTCGWEAAGAITVRVEAIGYESAEQTVVVAQGECHVIPEHVAIVLEPAGVDCTAEVVPSVIATVTGSSGEALSDVNVEWGRPDSDMAPQPCEAGSGGTWMCGEEAPGDLELYATAGGHVGQIVPVYVDQDECHVITEYVDIALDWMDD